LPSNIYIYCCLYIFYLYLYICICINIHKECCLYIYVYKRYISNILFKIYVGSAQCNASRFRSKMGLLLVPACLDQVGALLHTHARATTQCIAYLPICTELNKHLPSNTGLPSYCSLTTKRARYEGYCVCACVCVCVCVCDSHCKLSSVALSAVHVDK